MDYKLKIKPESKKRVNLTLTQDIVRKLDELQAVVKLRYKVRMSYSDIVTELVKQAYKQEFDK